ncbi:WG repeat-containing protein [Oceanobacillus alkalisoli]|uniref:WG repeat-containing protein n=1 Tax=Oceanobacillus alkalisoli TaxID=2925113 RepID=UPI001F1203C3|nr:WG repeat-containing protein [Oceanobacillus alkalisoli]MCF3944942.1 WG repeat-containing protein [Oceanobacillus alkalisoli]
MDKDNMLKAKHGKVCIINTAGKIVIEPEIEVDTIYYPSNGLCQVGRDGKYGYIDETGKLVIPLKYKKVFPFSENGLAFVLRENGLGGYIDKHDNFVIHPIYESGSTFRFGFAAVSRNGEYTFIHEDGNKAVDHTFKYASGFAASGLAKTQEFDGRYGLMDATSMPVLILKHGCELAEFKGDSKITKFRVNEKEALINSQGEIITGLNYDKVIISPNSKLHPFLRNGLWGYIDDEGNEIIANIYKVVSEFSEFNVAAVKSYHPLAENNLVDFYINDRDEIIDNKLIEFINQLLSYRFSNVSRFKNGLALAEKKEEIRDISEKRGKDECTRSCKVKADEEDYYAEKLHEVEIYFNSMDKKGIYKFINEELRADVRVLDVHDNYVKLLWPLQPHLKSADVENTLDDALNDGKLGRYNYDWID